ncbi:uncharacterized protein M6B38_399690 [Iris pallida]|uniref:Uncharacterized protein n=1 Tax=Iris pallida TaxID=29817 RepID=A0AAX6FVB4_IRIPA|nr:uncharacterized protein M6B38_399690 [Iris pallida]
MLLAGMLGLGLGLGEEDITRRNLMKSWSNIISVNDSCYETSPNFIGRSNATRAGSRRRRRRRPKRAAALVVEGLWRSRPQRLPEAALGTQVQGLKKYTIGRILIIYAHASFHGLVGRDVHSPNAEAQRK